MTSAIGGMNYEKRFVVSPKKRRAIHRARSWAVEAAELSPMQLCEELNCRFAGIPSCNVEEARESRNAVLSTCRELHGAFCLPRALAILFYCTSVYGTRPTLVVGARIDPFQAHAWIKVSDIIIDEFPVNNYFEELYVF